MSIFLRLHKLGYIFLPAFKSVLNPAVVSENWYSRNSNSITPLDVSATPQGRLFEFIKSTINIKQ